MSNVLLEAMAAAKAVVATDVEGVRETLGEQAIDQIADSSADGFARKVAQLLAAHELRVSLGIENRRRVMSHFTLRTAIARYEALYERLVQAG